MIFSRCEPSNSYKKKVCAIINFCLWIFWRFELILQEISRIILFIIFHPFQSYFINLLPTNLLSLALLTSALACSSFSCWTFNKNNQKWNIIYLSLFSAPGHYAFQNKGYLRKLDFFKNWLLSTWAYFQPPHIMHFRISDI